MAKIGKVLLSPIAAIGSLLSKKPKAPKAPAPVPVPTRNDAAMAALAEDDIRRRKGQRANDLTGGGAEARSLGGRTLLGQ